MGAPRLNLVSFEKMTNHSEKLKLPDLFLNLPLLMVGVGLVHVSQSIDV